MTVYSIRLIDAPQHHALPLERGDKLQNTPALDAAQKWRRTTATLLVLAGPVGTGKSLAAAWTLHDWWIEELRAARDDCRRYYEGQCWIAAPHLARMRKWDEAVAKLERAPMLVLDDLGHESSTDAAAELVQSVVTTRFAEERPTVITTNLDQKTFRPRYGERIVDRVRECGLDENGHARWWVRCSGESLRGKQEPKRRELPGDTDVLPMGRPS